ncbi:unnamed protein product, partial [Ectocarpus sp. 12 AP-2014]
WRGKRGRRWWGGGRRRRVCLRRKRIQGPPTDQQSCACLGYRWRRTFAAPAKSQKGQGLVAVVVLKSIATTPMIIKKKKQH